ncbi:hypothetical protein ASPACDRAFT_77320 [Aspergillus aculeatus ATCC 16872]|uniref:Uncharacterized protein n=1 Tax=Aspergillus aculeatus (strain ATCC 16872 / CBS 172.66 / WB 5094) TaxID=690307 RepID=A0A1L9WZG9_ASPA1|nr:uncharacterized protein ASPACDRAFT_77320 [Aspergillus aculeatus ATCC 16872]OJK01601.1 hypothetical protein ASPACDRAFT_77320 [Aspergillus aculeatus ATCC 16872]
MPYRLSRILPWLIPLTFLYFRLFLFVFSHVQPEVFPKVHSPHPGMPGQTLSEAYYFETSEILFNAHLEPTPSHQHDWIETCVFKSDMAP